jgi:hypothetical protein
VRQGIETKAPPEMPRSGAFAGRVMTRRPHAVNQSSGKRNRSRNTA